MTYGRHMYFGIEKTEEWFVEYAKKYGHNPTHPSTLAFLGTNHGTTGGKQQNLHSAQVGFCSEHAYPTIYHKSNLPTAEMRGYHHGDLLRQPEVVCEKTESGAGGRVEANYGSGTHARVEGALKVLTEASSYRNLKVSI